MNELVVHPLTARQLRHLNAHALLVAGPEGIGKSALAAALAQKTLGLKDQTAIEKYPHIRFVAPEENGSISIDAVRQLLQFTKLKVAGPRSSAPQRIIIIEQAQAMTPEAQNALLKLLEEPPANTLFVLTASSEQQLLPTIRSRTQIITIKRPGEQALLDHFAGQGFNAVEIQKAYLMSGGLPGLMRALLHEADHPMAAAATQARALLQASAFERLTQVDTLAKQKTDCQRVLAVLQQMAQVALDQAASQEPNASSDRTLKRWQRILSASYDAETALLNSAQPKLALTNFMLAL